MNAIVRSECGLQRFTPVHDRHRFRFQKVYGYSTFYSDCGRRWKSEYGWMTLDMHKQRVDRLWKQKCQRCYDECIPQYDDEEIKNMVSLVIKRFRRNRSDDRPYVHRQHRASHDSNNCELCDYGRGTPCYVAPTAYTDDEEEDDDDDEEDYEDNETEEEDEDEETEEEDDDEEDDDEQNDDEQDYDEEDDDEDEVDEYGFRSHSCAYYTYSDNENEDDDYDDYYGNGY